MASSRSPLKVWMLIVGTSFALLKEDGWGVGNASKIL